MMAQSPARGPQAVVRHTILFWLLLAAMAFGEDRRDPTRPSPSIQQRLARPIAAAPSAASNVKVKAIVLSHPDRGTALLETPSGIVRVSLNRAEPTEVVLDNCRYIVKDFGPGSIQLRRADALAW